MKRRYLLISVGILFASIFAALFINLIRLPNVDLYYRCYSQLTQEQPPNDARLIGVKNGTLDPIQACKDVLNLAVFKQTSGGPEGCDQNNSCLADPNNITAKKVLRTMHSLHFSWFREKEFPEIEAGPHIQGNRDIYDTSSPALYFTRALFQSNGNAAEVFTLPDGLEAVRTNFSPDRGPASGNWPSVAQVTPQNPEYFIYSPLKFAAMGELIGVRRTGPQTTNWDGGSNDLAGFQEGGVLGTTPYIVMTVNENVLEEYKANGADKMPRKYARAIFNDFLCRDLPAVRLADISALVDANASAPFRRQASCTRCHATMDRLAAGIRNTEFIRPHTPGSPTPERASVIIRKYPIDQASGQLWPIAPDANYHRRPPRGVLFFRAYDGRSVNESFNGLTELGQKLAAQDDYYICWAKRYFRYFTGIDTEIRELNDPSERITLTNDQMEYRNIIIQLGLNFKNHKNPRHLIEDILNLPEYADPGYGQ